MAEISQLLSLLEKKKATEEPAQSLHSDVARAALVKFQTLLRAGIGKGADGKLGFVSWSEDQIAAVVSAAKLIVAESFATEAVEQMDPPMVMIIEDSLLLCTLLLENWKFESEELRMENDVANLFEVTLLGNVSESFSTSCREVSVDYSKLFPVVSEDHVFLSVPKEYCSDMQEDEEPGDKSLVDLASDDVRYATHESIYPFLQVPRSMISLAQHWATFHLKFPQRILLSSKDMLRGPEPSEDLTKNSNFHLRISFSLRILKMLTNLAKHTPYLSSDVELLNALMYYSNNVLALFYHELDLFNHDIIGGDDGVDGHIVSLLEEVIDLVGIVFSDGCTVQNFQAAIATSIMDMLDISDWHSSHQNSSWKPSFAYSSKAMVFLLKLIGNIYSGHTQSYDSIDRLDIDHSKCSSSEVNAVWGIGSREICLQKEYKLDEHLRFIFAPSKCWVDNLVHAAFFLHSEGVKLKLKVDRLLQCHTKNSMGADSEAAFSHEDDALFGDLFSEASRPLGQLDSIPDNPAITSVSNSHCLLVQAAYEWLLFLKICIFNPSWNKNIFDDACKKINEAQIISFITMLSCHACLLDDKQENVSVSILPRNSRTINEACFELLHSLVAHHALSHELEEFLVEQILGIENGRNKYKDCGLSLVAHTLMSRTGVPFKLLACRIFNFFVDSILHKANSTWSSCLDVRETVGALPSVFHLEVLIMAFYSSGQPEKHSLIQSLMHSLKALIPPPSVYSTRQLSSWSLLVSQLVLLIQHMLLYPAACPSWLQIHFRSKLKEVPHQMASSHSISFASWTSTSIQNIMVDYKELPCINSLLPQLVDFGVSFTARQDYVNLQNFVVNCDELLDSLVRILELWEGKKAETVEDLIIERYVHVLCWNTASVFSYAGNVPQIELRGLSLNTKSFLQFGQFLLSDDLFACTDIDLSATVLELLGQLQSSLAGTNMMEQTWRFLRLNSWLALIVSLLQFGLWGYALKNNVHGVKCYWSDSTALDKRFLNSTGNLIEKVFNGNHFGLLVSILSSCLNLCLKAYEKAFLGAFDYKKSSANTFSPLLLLKHVAFDKCNKGDIMQICGCSSSQLDSLFCLISRLDAYSRKGDVGDQRHKVPLAFIFRAMLHGFPSFSTSVPSAALASSILNIQSIVYALDGLIKCGFDPANPNVEVGIIHEVLSSSMTLKEDKCFQVVHENCDSLYSKLCGSLEESASYNCLFRLKSVEDLLRTVSGKDLEDSTINETLVTVYIDLVENLRRDHRKAEVFNLFLDIGNPPKKVKELFRDQQGDLLVLINSLDRCNSESVNVKVLDFFVDLLGVSSLSTVKKKVLHKFLEMDLACLSKWIEIRLLGGNPSESHKGSSSLRESTVNFLTYLVSEDSGNYLSEFHSHITEAMLMCLDNAFVSYDIYTSKAYFNFVVQILNGKPSFKLLLKRVILLTRKLAGNEGVLQGLKFLFGFLGSVLHDCGANKSVLDKLSGKYHQSSSLSAGSLISSPVSSRKSSDSLGLPASQGSTSGPAEFDATSAEEDEDDGTSDGELASIDKEEEEDTNSERALASKVCTFTSSGSNFMEQHWYFCYSCDLTVSKGCCSVCAKVCHRGHRVVYSRCSRFFCDCGAGGVRGSTCQCLKPRKYVSSSTASVRTASNLQSFLPYTEDGEHAADSDSDLDEDVYADGENSFKLSVPKDLEEGLALLLEDLGMEGQLLELCDKLLPSVMNKRDMSISKDKKILLNKDKVVSYKTDIFHLKKTYKSGSFDLKIRADYSNSRELKSHLTSGSLMKSLLSMSGRGRLAAGEGDKVAIFDAGQLIGQPSASSIAVDKSNIKPLSRNIMRFEIVHLLFNPVMENYLVVAGYEECQVLTVNPRGEVTDRLAVELASHGAYIRRVDWVPGSQVQLLVVTNMFVKIYDLSQDNISPMHYFTLEDDSIMDATLVVAPMGRLFLFVLSELGQLFRLELSREGDVGAKPLKEVFEVPGRISKSKGLSLYFSSLHRLLFLSYQDGVTLVGRLDSNATAFSETPALCEDDLDGQRKAAALHHWKELLTDRGIFICFSNLKLNSAFAVYMGQHELYAQNMRHTVSSNSSPVGIAAYRALSKDKSHCLVLFDDGSLQVYLHTPAGVECPSSTSSNSAMKLGAGILSNKVYASSNPEFPLDFFEKTICITADVKLSCEVLKGGDPDSVKQKLASDDGFLESPSPSGFKITVSNLNPEIVMVGIRIHVGNTSPIHIPADVTIFHRVIKLDEGMRSWYDIPFTIAESLLADEEFVVSVGSTFDAATLPRIDSLEVYGRTKDEFGWKEKMDAIMDMADVLGSNPGPVGARKRSRNVKASTIQEQLLADALNILAKLYSLCNGRTCTDVEQANQNLQTLRCKKILDKIFESDREPLLQAAACHVLQAIFPRKEIYYHVKDTMRLYGVMKSSPILSSRIGIGGVASSWVIKEFIAKTRAVSKIAMLRSSNMATFIEANGPEVIDGLMQVLWEILDLEQPDTQTINNIVIPSVELIYSYAECLAFNEADTSRSSVAPAVKLLKRLLFAPYESVQMSSSLAISSRLLQVPFPKQTILTSDETLETSATACPRSDVGSATSGNMQAVIEEDSTASSVQYCCDGCSTVPILRRRWHCNVCPDFDLCEACYEVMDADRLPPPHSRDHPMSAIPIDIDSIGECGEIQFSMDELNEGSLMQVASDTRMHTSPPVNVTESTEMGDFSVVDQRVVSISASKRAVNTLLLLQLIDELKGWMETTSGVRAIPIMQLFYRLSSAVGGPFTDGSNAENLDLEKFIRWFLDQLNLYKPFTARSRSYFSEVSILVFMFLTLMLRNWHHPTSDGAQQKPAGQADTPDKCYTNAPLSSPAASANESSDKNEFASQLIRACSYLRQQSFVNCLMDILQQLVGHFKSSPTNADGYHYLPSNSGCGSLLTIRRELPAGYYSPFFSDSYAKAHRSDLFFEYHKLLLENTFRLLYSLVRPEKQDKSVDKEKMHKVLSSKDLKLDGYQDVLCYYISNPHTSFVRRYARRLFLHLCGSKTNYYSIRDYWQFSNEVGRLYKLINKSGGFQNPLSYERSVKLVKCLSTIAEVAGSRPRNWQKYCSKHSDILSFLVEGIYNFDEESVIRILKLLNFSLYPGKDIIATIPKPDSGEAGTSLSKQGSLSVDAKRKKKGDDGSDTNNDKLILDMAHAVEILFKKDDSLRHFIDTFLLDWNSSTVRVEAKCVLYGAWHHGRRSFKEALASVLLEQIQCLPLYGQNILEYSELLTMILGKVSDSSKQQEIEVITKCLTTDILSCIFKTLRSQNELLANHPNSRIYNTLSSLVEFDGYYLESEPCVACSCPEVPYTKMKLESLKFETKFTDNRIIVKCTGSYTIQSVSMNVHDARKSKSVKVLNLYYNNRPVSDLSELKNNWSLWKRAKSCHLAFNQTELKVDFAIPITACNFMIELDSFYENLQASSLESLQCPRCSRPVTDKHGICSNCRENAYQCRQCRNINYENLDSFLCNECGYSKYGRFEFNFMARPSFLFDNMENDEDMKKGLTAIESESENAHRRYQQLMGFKKPLLKLVSNIGEHDIDSQQKDSVQQMMASLPGPSCKINRKIALLGVLYGEKCKTSFDSLSKSVQTLQGLRRVLMGYLQQKNSGRVSCLTRFTVPRSKNNCYGCATAFVTQCMELILILAKYPNCKKQLVASGILSELFENNLHQGPKTSRVQARAVLCAFTEGDSDALSELNNLIQRKAMYCLDHHRSIDIASATREELLLLSEICAIVDDLWETRLRIAFHLLFASIKRGAKHPAISEHIILPCLRIISQACTPPKYDIVDKDQGTRKPDTLKNDDSKHSLQSVNSHPNEGKSGSDLSDKLWESNQRGHDIQLVSYSEWERGASYLDFVRRQYKMSQAVKSSLRSRQSQQRSDFLALKYGLIWKRACCRRTAKSDFSAFELGSWVSELILSACSQSIRAEVCNLINLLCPQTSTRQFQLLNLLMTLLPATLPAGESAAEYFDLLFKVIDAEIARLFLTAKGCLRTVCRLITQEVSSIESQERSLNIDISQGFILHKLVELLSKFLEVPNIRQRFMRDELLSDMLESLIIVRGLIVQKTKIINDCHKLLKDLLDGLLLESEENKRQFIRACVCGLQTHEKEIKGRNRLFILEQLRNIICPSKPEPVYQLVLNKSHTQEEYIRGSMTKNPYSSTEIGPLMRDVKNKICHQLDLLGLVEDDYGMELLVAGNIISLDLSISQVYEQVWRKSQIQMQSALAGAALVSSGSSASSREFPPMTVTYRLQGLDGEATEPMIKELEEEREEFLDPEIEFAIAGSVREFGGLEIILRMIQMLRDDDLKSNQEELASVLSLLMYCCKIRENRRALLHLGALGVLLDTARRAFSVDAMEPAEGVLLIVESLVIEANESDFGITQSVRAVEETVAGEQAKRIVLMFLERLCHPSGIKKSNKQQRNNEMVARILPYLTYGEPEAMDALVQHFVPYLQDWVAFDRVQKAYQGSPNDDNLAQEAGRHRSEVENFVRVSESLKTSSSGERLKDIILEKGITVAAVKHLKQSFALFSTAGFKSNPEWINSLMLPSVPLILSMLRGLSRGHVGTQRYIDDEDILPLLHLLEGVSGENEIGVRAENLLDTLSDREKIGDGFLGEKIDQLRHTTRNEMRQRALQKRKEMLQGLGMRQELASDGGERIIVKQPAIEGLDDVEEEEDGLACMVCREGYTLRPSDMLGVYAFSKRVNLGASASGNSRGDCVYTTVSHFNIIHFQCHQEAKRADAALKNPKKEWEGAALRNNETLCNCIFPLRGPSIPPAQYIRCVDQYWDNLSSLGRADGSRLRLLTYDVVLMLARFATGASFSADSKGGGRESNSRLLPFMIQMACHLIDQGTAGQQRRSMAKTIAAYLSSASSDSPTRPLATGRSSANSSDETVQFMMVNSLFAESYEEWSQHLLPFLQRGIYHAYMQHTHGRSNSKLSPDLTASVLRANDSSDSSSHLSQSNKIFPIIQPMLVYAGLIEQLQRFFKLSRPSSSFAGTSAEAEKGSVNTNSLEKWEILMRERLLNVKEMLSFSKELLSWLEDMTTSADIQEALDVMGALGAVFSGGYSKCEDFVQTAITSGKS